MRTFRSDGAGWAAALAVALSLGGCASDPVAPRDDLPPLGRDDVANQAGLLASVLVNVAPELVRAGFEPQGKDTYTFDFTGEVAGSLSLDFRCGGPEGTPCSHDQADWGRIWTPEPEGLYLAAGTDVTIAVDLDLAGTIDQAISVAVVGGSGVLRAGEYETNWSVAGLVVATSGYPAAGTLTATNGAHAVVVNFAGTGTAAVTVDDEVIGYVDLDSGVFTPAS
ncbi:MAG: hypothetical protein R6X25_12200 [Candidatus Krumholzibacteriia bacterium]